MRGRLMTSTKEDFEIISTKEKVWRDHLDMAEKNLAQSEAGLLINESIVRIAKEEVKKEADKNAR